VRFIDAHLGAFAAIDAVFPPHDLELGHKLQIERSGLGMDVVFLRHDLCPPL
jgi:hypothetical protein